MLDLFKLNGTVFFSGFRKSVLPPALVVEFSKQSVAQKRHDSSFVKKMMSLSS